MTPDSATTAQEALPLRSYPGWFSAVMGTASLSVAAYRLPDGDGPTQGISGVMGPAFLALALLGLLIIVAANLAHRTPWRVLWREVRSRERGPAYAAVPGALLMIVLAIEAGVPDLIDRPVLGWVLIGITVLVALADLMLTLVFFSAAIANRGAIEEDALTGVWFMPQTVLLLSAAAFARLSSAGNADLTTVAAPLAVLFLGAGILLFMLVGSLVLGRLVTTALAPTSGVPATWIMMGPAAASAVALMSLPLVTPELLGLPSSSVTPVTSLLAGMFIGFSIWWLLMVVMLTLNQGRASVTFSPASWSYVFPLAAVAVASSELAGEWDSPVMVTIALTMDVLAVGVWFAVFVVSLIWLRARLRREAHSAQ